MRGNTSATGKFIATTGTFHDNMDGFPKFGEHLSVTFTFLHEEVRKAIEQKSAAFCSSGRIVDSSRDRTWKQSKVWVQAHEATGFNRVPFVWSGSLCLKWPDSCIRMPTLLSSTMIVCRSASLKLMNLSNLPIRNRNLSIFSGRSDRATTRAC